MKNKHNVCWVCAMRSEVPMNAEYMAWGFDTCEMCGKDKPVMNKKGSYGQRATNVLGLARNR